MGSTHALKVWSPFFEALADGSKTFEVRRDDRGFATHDLLLLYEWDAEAEHATGRALVAEVTYVFGAEQDPNR